MSQKIRIFYELKKKKGDRPLKRKRKKPLDKNEEV